MAQFRSKPFGVTKNGEKVNEYIMSNPGGLAVSVLNYGCVIKNIFVPTKHGPVDVVVGHDTFADYENDFNSSSSTCCGRHTARSPMSLCTCSPWSCWRDSISRRGNGNTTSGRVWAGSSISRCPP